MIFNKEQLDKVKTVLGLIDDGKPTLADLKKLVALLINAVKDAAKQLDAKIDARLVLIKDGTNGRDGRDGKDGVGTQGPKGDKGEPGQSIVGPAGRDGSPDMAEDIRNKLELLTGDERLDKSAIRGLDTLEADLQAAKSVRVLAGRSLLQLQVDGKKKGAIQYLNLVAGSGVTLTYDSSNGRNDIVINADGGGEGGSFSVIAVSGTIDDSNVSFTAASTPTVVVVNGASYRDGHGCTITGTAITLDNPVGQGGDIYAL